MMENFLAGAFATYVAYAIVVLIVVVPLWLIFKLVRFMYYMYLYRNVAPIELAGKVVKPEAPPPSSYKYGFTTSCVVAPGTPNEQDLGFEQFFNVLMVGDDLGELILRVQKRYDPPANTTLEYSDFIGLSTSVSNGPIRTIMRYYNPDDGDWWIGLIVEQPMDYYCSREPTPA